MKTAQAGKRYTRQRDAIAKVLRDSAGPLGVQDIYARARRVVAGLGLATVYRTLRLLKENAQVDEVTLPHGEIYYELSGLCHHHHFHCRQCRQVFDAHLCPLTLPPGAVLPAAFRVESHEVTLYGLCAQGATSFPEGTKTGLLSRRLD